jgi:hypothetical protein
VKHNLILIKCQKKKNKLTDCANIFMKLKHYLILIIRQKKKKKKKTETYFVFNKINFEIAASFFHHSPLH